MTESPRVLEDPASILGMLRRLVAHATPVGLQGRGPKWKLEPLACPGDRFILGLPKTPEELAGLHFEEKLTLFLEDRTLHFEATVTFQGTTTLEGLSGLQISLPRSLRRTDAHRFSALMPEPMFTCSFSTGRGALLQGRVQGLSDEGLELTLLDRRQRVEDLFRMGEEAAVDLSLDLGRKFGAHTRVAYFAEAAVGLRFTPQNDQGLLEEYQRWLEAQRQLQLQRDQETAASPWRSPRAPETSRVHVLVDRDPLLLVLSEKEDVAKRLAEAFGRKFGIAWLNHIKGAIHPQLAPLGAHASSWGRARLILVHHQLTLASPLDVLQQLSQRERCPLPMLAAGTEEDVELKANRAIAMGAVDYLVLEPFRILAVLKRLETTLGIFA